MAEVNNDHAAANGPVDAGNRPLSLSDRVRSLRLPERSGAPRSRFAWLPWALCLLLASSTAFFAVRSAETPGETGPNPSQVKKQPEGAAPAAPRRTDDIALESKGYIIPVHQIQVSPKVGGMVIELNIEEGMWVKEGAVLAKLETTEYKADYDRAFRSVEAAKHRWHELFKYRDDEIQQVKAELEESQAELERLDQDYKRSVALKASNAIAPRDFEQAVSSYKAMESRVARLKLAYELMKAGPRDERIAAAKAEMQQAEAELVKAKWRLDNTTVTAPVSGTILTKKAEKGNMVNPSAFSNGLAASLCDMADLSDMEVDLAIAERDIGKVFKGQKCKLRAEAFPDRIYEGEVSRLMPTADRGKGAVPVRVKIAIPREEEGMFLRPDMGAIVTFFNKK
jgi:multidrug resistance efflux pump